MLRGDDGALVETLLHELVHATVFVASQADFNEGVASFVGEEGSVRFFAETAGAEAAARERARVGDSRTPRERDARLPAGGGRRSTRATLRPKSAPRNAPQPRRARAPRSPRFRSRRAIPRASPPIVRLSDACLALTRTYAADVDAYAATLAALDGSLPAVHRAPARSGRDGGSARGAARALSPGPRELLAPGPRPKSAADPRLPGLPADRLPMELSAISEPSRLRTQGAARSRNGAVSHLMRAAQIAEEGCVNSASPEQRTGAMDALPRLTVSEAAAHAGRLRANIERALRGKPEVVRRAVETLVAGGHLLLEDVPGVGKTTLAHALARSIDASFRRIQFTSDLLPGDLIGAALPELRGGTAHRPLRVPARAALRERRARRRDQPREPEGAVGAARGDERGLGDGRRRHAPAAAPLPRGRDAEPARAPRHAPAARVAARPLPDAARDRLPRRRRRSRRAARGPRGDRAARPRAGARHRPRCWRCSALAASIKFDDTLVAYLLAIVHETREHEALAVGVSPRGAIALRRGAQARALLDGRDYCIPDDVRDLAVDVLCAPRAARPRGPGAAGRRGDRVDRARDPRTRTPSRSERRRAAPLAASAAHAAARPAPAGASSRSPSAWASPRSTPATTCSTWCSR